MTLYYQSNIRGMNSFGVVRGAPIVNQDKHLIGLVCGGSLQENTITAFPINRLITPLNIVAGNV